MMRILEYKLELTERGYTVVSSGRRHYDEKVQANACLPIKMAVLECWSFNGSNNLVDLVDGDSITQVGQEETEFSQHYQEILRGDREKWMLTMFNVSAESIWLDFCNVETGETGGLVLQGALTLELRFEVPHENGILASQYKVRVMNDVTDRTDVLKYHTVITEYHGGIQREISLHHISDAPSSSPRYAYVTEYVDF